MEVADYIGRFAPSPTGPLHEGSLVAALASWLDARAHGGRWLVRIEDVDMPRCLPGMDAVILGQLAACGLVPDAQPLWQSARGDIYQQALDRLVAQGLAYPCGCSRKEIEAEWLRLGRPPARNAELVYPGTCRHGISGLHGRPAKAWRLHVEKFSSNRPLAQDASALPATESIANSLVTWHDRLLGPQSQNVAAQVGDFVLRRADGLWAYQLAVVVDDAAQGITHVVRGADLADNTPRQILLQRALGLPTPAYMHTPLVLGDNGEKLSKQNGARAFDSAAPLAALTVAARHLGLPAPRPAPDASHDPIQAALSAWVPAWRALYNRARE